MAWRKVSSVDTIWLSQARCLSTPMRERIRATTGAKRRAPSWRVMKRYLTPSFMVRWVYWRHFARW